MSFYTEVIRKDARFRTTKRVDTLDLLEPTFRHKIEAILSDAKQHGVDLMVYETYRSQERQQILFEQHATTLRKVGVHHYGLACDIVYRVHGEPSWKGSFNFLGHLAHAHNLVWGGDWKTFVDADHVQFCAVKHQGKLFSGAWYPGPNYDPTV
jgi:hypothetical protein